MASAFPSFKFTFLCFFISIAIITCSCSSLRYPDRMGKVGGRVEIKDVKSNEEVQDLGKFSVDQYNKNQGVDLSFKQVVEGQKQVVSGIKYYLRIEAVDNGKYGEYNAVVVVKAWLKSKELVSFAPATK